MKFALNKGRVVDANQASGTVLTGQHGHTTRNSAPGRAEHVCLRPAGLGASQKTCPCLCSYVFGPTRLPASKPPKMPVDEKEANQIAKYGVHGRSDRQRGLVYFKVDIVSDG